MTSSWFEIMKVIWLKLRNFVSRLQAFCYSSHCAKAEFARMLIGACRVYQNILRYSRARNSKHNWNILLQSSLFFRIQFE